MSEQTSKSDENVFNKKDFHVSKEAYTLDSVESNRILVSDKFKHGDGCIYFIGYLHNDDVIRPLCIILPQMSRYIKYFDNVRKNMSYLIENENVYLKYTKIWKKIKRLLNIKFHSQPILDDKYIKTKVKTFDETINTVFSHNNFPKEKSHYICIEAICIDSVLKKKEKTSSSVFRTMQIQNKKKKACRFY